MERVLIVLTFVAALGAGLNAGVFFAFSTFVMAALARLPPAEGLAAMNSINVVAVTPPFMTALFGTGLVCLVLVVAAIVTWQQPGTAWLLAGSVLYAAGVVVVTMMFNVPLNNQLAATPASAEGAAFWSRYVSVWTAWNHVRAVAPLLAAACFVMALLART
jgi:uncharacterized membrane protein